MSSKDLATKSTPACLVCASKPCLWLVFKMGVAG